MLWHYDVERDLVDTNTKLYTENVSNGVIILQVLPLDVVRHDRRANRSSIKTGPANHIKN